MAFFYILLFFFAVSTVRAFQTKSDAWIGSSVISGAIVIIAFFLASFDKMSTFERINLDSSLVVEKNGAYYTIPAFFDGNNSSKGSQIIESKQKPTGVLVRYGTSLAGIVTEKGYTIVFD